MKRKIEHWAYTELKRRLEEKTETIIPHFQDAREPQILRIKKIPDHEQGTVFLMNPTIREELDKALLERIYPHVLETMEGEALVVPNMQEIQRSILDDREPEANRIVTFLVSDPARSVLSTNRPLWHFRFTLKVRLLSYMLSSDCSISVPFPVASHWLLDVLADSRMQGLPPHLSTDSDEFVLSFSAGRGKCYIGNDWKRSVAEAFRRHIKIAETVDRFEEQPYNYIIRSEMIETVVSTYADQFGQD